VRAPADPLTGYANADCIERLGKDELGEYLGALSPASMRWREPGPDDSTGPYLRTRPTPLTPARGPVEATPINACAGSEVGVTAPNW